MGKEHALVESVALRHAAIAIKPFISDNPNTGLKEYNMAVHERIKHTDIVVCKVDGRTKEYLTGINEAAESVQMLEGEEKEARIKSIRELVVRAENAIGGNFDISDADIYEIDEKGKSTTKFNKLFWSKVKTFKSVFPDVLDNRGQRVNTWWDDYSIILTNDGIILNSDKVKDQITVSLIEAGGLSMIAKSYEDALQVGRCKFYLDKREDTSAILVADDMSRDRAGAKLIAMKDGDANKLFYVTKLVSTDSLFFKTNKNATPTNVLYKECVNFIEGKTSIERSKGRACTRFIELASMTLDQLKARCVLQDAKTLRLVAIREQELYIIKGSTIIGKNDEEAASFLLNTVNVKTYENLLKEVQKEWSK